MSVGDGVGKRIKTTRESKHMSASTLARLAEVTPTAVWNWETNEICPRQEALVKVARALGVSEDFLRTGREDQTAALDHRLEQVSVSDLLEQTRLRLAQMTGVDVASVRLNLEIVAG